MITNLAKSLFAEKPQHTLYHYTSLNGAMGIIENRSVRATEIRYFSDAAEMKHTVNLLLDNIHRFSPLPASHLRNWLTDRLTGGHQLFVACFTANGNLLSQWRSYSPTKGASLGFDAAKLYASATRQGCQIGKCVYDPKEQKSIAIMIVEHIRGLLKTKEKALSNREDETRYYRVFQEVELDLLRIAALLKHPAFHEEEEWRVVSPVITNCVEEPIKYREGPSMLIPFMNFRLPEAPDRRVDIEHAVLGPTPNANISMESLSNYLSKNGASPRKGLAYCGIPYRPW